MTLLNTWEQNEFRRPNCRLYRKPGDYLSLSAFIPTHDLSQLKRFPTWAPPIPYPANWDRCAAVLYDEAHQRFPFLGTWTTTLGSELLLNTGFEDFTGTADDGETDDFDHWTNYGTGSGDIVEATTTKHSGDYACKITYGNNGCGTYQQVTVTPETLYKLEFYTRGDFWVAGRYMVRDATHDAPIIDATTTGISWPVGFQKVTVYFYTPADCVAVRIYLISPPSSGFAMFDDVSLKPGSDEEWIASLTVDHLSDDVSDISLLGTTPVTLAGTHKQNALYIFDKCMFITGDGNVVLADDYQSFGDECYSYGDALALLPALDRIWLLNTRGDLLLWHDGPVAPSEMLLNTGFESFTPAATPSELIANGNFEDFTGTKDDMNTDTFASWTNQGTGTYDKILAVTGPTGGTSIAVRIYRSTHADGDPTGTGAGMFQTVTVTAETAYVLQFRTRGNNDVEGSYRIRDNTNGGNIVPVTRTRFDYRHDYAMITVPFTTPAGCTSINVYLIGPEKDGSAYFADVSLKAAPTASDTITNWTATGTGLHDRITADTDAHDGARALKFTRSSDGTGAAVYQHNNAVEPSLTYRLSFYTKGDGTVAGRYMLRDRTNGTALIPPTSTRVTSAAEYVRITATITLPRDCHAVTLFLLAPDRAGSCLFDDVSLTRLPAGFEHWHTTALELSIRHILHYRDHFVLFCRAEDGTLMLYRLDQHYPVVLIASDADPETDPITRIKQIAHLANETGFYQPHDAALDWSLPHVTHQDLVYFSPGAYVSPDPPTAGGAAGDRRFCCIPIHVYKPPNVTLVDVVTAPAVPDTWGLLTWRGQLLLYFAADQEQYLYLYTGDRFTQILATTEDTPAYADIYAAAGELILNVEEEGDEGLSFLRAPAPTNVFTSSWLDMGHPTADKFLSHVAAVISAPAEDLTAKLEYRTEHNGTTSGWIQACAADQRRHLSARNLNIPFHLLQLRVTFTDATDNDPDTRLESVSATYSYGIK